MADESMKHFRTIIQGNEDKKISDCINSIMNTLSFRKLAGKTQVILSLSGPDVRTRLTHTIEVAKIAKDICHELKLNEALAEAIALAHDIGHTPFGHVGERTLREIMCGCDTLGGKLPENDFNNAGFKHNLQSFRVLKNLEHIDNDEIVWPYVLWGAAVHTKMTYAKSYSGLEDEIFISCRHCEWVYSCSFDKEHKCKHNKNDRNNENKSKNKTIDALGVKICRPWYCALLEEDNKGNIEEKYKNEVFCSKKCYMAKLWKNKLGKNKLIFRKFKYLFDHPFPNIFYASFLNEYFNNQKIQDWVTIEAQIVSQADEIAQRQQDLEDGINKRLISLEEANNQVKGMVEAFKDEDKISEILKKIEDADTPKALGEQLVKFYKNLLINSTRKNFNKFIQNIEKEKINIYFLLNIIYLISGRVKEKKKWILWEIKNLDKNNYIHNKTLDHYFIINDAKEYFFFLVYDYLDNSIKGDVFDEFDNKGILKKFVEYLEKNYPYESKYKKGEYSNIIDYIKEIDEIRDFLKSNFKNIYDEFFKKKYKEYCKNITHLNLWYFHVLYEIEENKSISVISDFDSVTNSIPETQKKFDTEKYSIYLKWKKILEHRANQVLANLVNFVHEDASDSDIDNKNKAITEFEKNQRDTILKSEIVEKNDGKASYILRKLFKAYITNAHQLPDEGLWKIFLALKEEKNFNNLIIIEKIKFEELLHELIHTIVFKDPNEKIRQIVDVNFIDTIEKNGLSKGEDFEKFKVGTSNEIRALIDERQKLYEFLIEKVRNKFEIESKGNNLSNNKQVIRNFRGILDNSILNAVPFWKSILVRGICDYIANLTDQEAINEYEKLYAGVMEVF